MQTENFACIYKIYGISEEGMSNLKFPGEGIFMLNWKFRGGGRAQNEIPRQGVGYILQ